MNGRKAKAYRLRGKELLVEWLQSVVPDKEDSKKVNVNNIEDYLTDQTHIYLNRKLSLSAYSLKWIYKKVKRNPDLTLEQLQEDLKG
tara:strand:+ start:42 stop:302 length:261 start_codon:yes stop_codon:yes gene_type:complete